MKFLLLIFVLLFFSMGCDTQKPNKESFRVRSIQKITGDTALPAPFSTPSATNFSKVIGWKDSELPIAPQGFHVEKFADGFSHPRWIYVADNGDIFIAESNTILKGIKEIGRSLAKNKNPTYRGKRKQDNAVKECSAGSSNKAICFFKRPQPAIRHTDHWTPFLCG